MSARKQNNRGYGFSDTHLGKKSDTSVKNYTSGMFAIKVLKEASNFTNMCYHS